MEKAKLELVVGVFVLVGIVCLGYLSIKLGKLEIIGGNRHDVNAEFDSVSGLKAGATGEIAGVEGGRGQRIGLQGDRGGVTPAVRNDGQLYGDTTAASQTRRIIWQNDRS